MARGKIITLLTPPPQPDVPRSGQPPNTNYVVRRQILFNPDSFVNIHPREHDPGSPHSNIYESWTRLEGGHQTFGAAIAACHIDTENVRHVNVEGFWHDVNKYLNPRITDPPADTGVEIVVTGDQYVLVGDANGPVLLKDRLPFVLDPDHLIRTEWELRRRPSSPGARYELQVASGSTFVLERWVEPSEPGGTGSWLTVPVGSLSLQATQRLRPQPVQGA